MLGSGCFILVGRVDFFLHARGGGGFFCVHAKGGGGVVIFFFSHQANFQDLFQPPVLNSRSLRYMVPAVSCQECGIIKRV